MSSLLKKMARAGAVLIGLAVGVGLMALFVITGEDEKETAAMEALVRRQVSFYGSTPSYAAVLEYHGMGALAKELNGLMREGRMDDMAAAVPDALLEHVAIIAPPGEIGARLRERYDGLLDRVSLYMAMEGDIEFRRWDTLVEAVHAA